MSICDINNKNVNFLRENEVKKCAKIRHGGHSIKLQTHRYAHKLLKAVLRFMDFKKMYKFEDSVRSPWYDAFIM